MPFNDVVDNTQATGESGEPWPCGGYTPQRTVWYVYTPPERMLLRANMDGSSFYDTVLTLYQTTSASSWLRGSELHDVLCIREAPSSSGPRRA